MKNLFIDDERLPEHVYWINYPENIKDWAIVKDYVNAVKYIEDNGLPDFISFDNDLGEHSKEGYYIALFIVEYCLDNNLKFPPCAVHSQNNIARDRIVSLVNNFNKVLNITRMVNK